MKDPNFESCDIKVYNLIYRRTLASQMSDAEIENQNIISNVQKNIDFIGKNQKILFDGFLKIYKPYEDNDNDDNDDGDENGSKKIDFDKLNLKVKDKITMKEINSIEKFTKPPKTRYTEASLVKKLEELGIGRPSTYSSMVSIVQDRNYVVKKDIEGEDKECVVLKLKNYEITESSEIIKLNSEKQKLVPTDIGEIVNNFLDLHFEEIINFNFTSNLEKQLDEIAKGEKKLGDCC